MGCCVQLDRNPGHRATTMDKKTAVALILDGHPDNTSENRKPLFLRLPRYGITGNMPIVNDLPLSI